MSVKVQKYLANLGKSVAYSTADVLSEKFTYAKDFKQENQEVFKEAYHSIKDYRTTYARIKKTITDNKVMDAARVGFDSIMYSVTTGDFYAKSKETEVLNKYGGNLMQGMDIDDDDFDFGNEDVTDGDKVIATAVKKNSKLQTAITTEAIVKTGKAQMDVSKENTMLLYTQNERLINKLDGGLSNITEILKQNAEQTAKVQNQMNDNLNKFMANVDNNVAKLTKQMDELLEMQRNLYTKQTNQDQNKKKKVGYDDIIGRGGVINLREYGKQVGKNAMNTLTETIPGLNMLLGDGGIEGANLLATMLANPMRELSKVAVNKALGKSFDLASKSLNKTLENIVPTLIAKANAAAKKEDAGLAGLLGKIFGIKTGSTENVDPNKYVKTAIPFDGITKKAIIDVIPFYLRKMMSAMTGGEEAIFDYTTGRWTSIKAAKKAYDTVTTSAQKGTESLIVGTLEAGTNRSFGSMYQTKDEYDRAQQAVQSLALKLQAAGDFGSLRESDLNMAERALYTSMKKIFQRSEQLRYKKDDKGRLSMRKGFSGPDVSVMDTQLLELLKSQNSAIKQLNEQGGIAMLAASEGITGDAKYHHGKSYVDASGDMNERHIQEMPTAQILLRAKDEYGVTLYQYLRNIGINVNTIRAYSTYLRNLTVNGINNGSTDPNNIPDFDKIISETIGGVDYKAGPIEKYTSQYYAAQERKAKEKARESFNKGVENLREKARKDGRSISFITNSSEYQSEGDQIGMSRLVSDYYGEGGEYETKYELEQRKEAAKKEKEKWKKMEELVGKETTDKLKGAVDKYDKDKGLMENLSKATGTTEKLAIAAKWFTQKTNFVVMDKVTNTVVKTDAWLRNLIYGEDLKPDDQKKSLWQLMKDHTQSFFDNVKQKLDEVFDPIKDYYNEKIKPHVDKVKKKIFGDVDSEGNILEEGLLSHFTAGFRKGMSKNADDVHKMWAKEIEEAKKLGSDIKDRIVPSPAPTPTLTASQRRAQRRSEIEHKLNTDTMSENPFISDNARERLININAYRRSGIYSGPIRTDAEANERRQALIAKAEAEVIDLRNKIAGQAPLFASHPELGVELRAKLEKAERKLAAIKSTTAKVRGMAAGGVNRTGKAFQSVLSAGEYLNGSKIGQTGIYTIPKGGVVYNPAPASVRNIQARNEKNFIKGLRYNAEANDGVTKVLTDEERAEHQKLDAEAKKRIEQVDISKLTDWESLEDSKQQAAFLGNMAARGAIGGVTGLLVGGPLLGAAVGAASTLSKSTGTFASFLFGDVEKDADGNIIVDAQGNPKRKDTGLISKELQKAAPDMAKFGMAGLGAGLLTPLGPLGGLIAGSALGFAKNSEIFQGSLFGEGGIFSEKNVDKLKKGAKNMGIGAAAAALFLPGPFGLVGSALIGATAGYVTSTDKFKDFLLGKEGEDGKRRGGVRGALNDNIVKPFMGFGRSIIDKTMDEIFGKKVGEDGKRVGGLFGAIRANVVEPMISGAQSILKEITNGIVDIKDFGKEIFKKIKASMAGNNLLGGVFETATKIGTGALGIAGKVGRAATKPFRLIGDEGIGGRLKAKRIRSGRADDMTARERLAARGSLKMAKTDQWSAIDEYLADGSTEDLQTLMNMLSFADGEGGIDKAVNDEYTLLGQELREKIDRKDAKKVIKMLKEGRERDVERFLTTRKYDDATKEAITKRLKSHKSKIDKAHKDYKELEDKGMTAQQYLVSKGINIDTRDKKAVRNLRAMTDRELAHKQVGLTDEELAFEAEKEFWKGMDSPLKTVNTAAENMEKLLENIHYDLTIGTSYDKLSTEDQAKYGSKEEYIKSVKNAKANAALMENAANGGYTVGRADKIGGIDRESIKIGDFVTNDLWNDYTPLFTGDLKGYLAADNRLSNVLNKEIEELIDTACQMFDGLALKELCVPERIKDDVTLKAEIIAQKEKCSHEDAVNKIRVLKRKIMISRGETPYNFEMTYSLDGNTVNPTKRQPASYDMAKRQFIEDYLQDHTPKTIETSYMSVGDMISKSLKLGLYMNPIKLPNLPAFLGIHSLFVKDAIMTHGKSIIGLASKGVKKIGFEFGLALGDHKLDDSSHIQKLNNYQYQQEAEKEWLKEVSSYQSAQNQLNAANTASEEVQKNLRAQLSDKFILLDEITKKCDLGIDRFGACNKNEIEKVHDKFVSMYVEAKRENQVFGRGLIGGLKQIGKRIKNSKLGQTVKLVSGAHKIIFKDNVEGTKEDRMQKLREKLKKKAEYVWANKMFIPNPNKKTPDAGPQLEMLVKEIYGKTKGENVAWNDLTEKEQNAIHTIFVERFIDGRYQSLMNSFTDNIKGGIVSKVQGISNKIGMGIRTMGARAANFAKERKQAALKKASEIKRKKVIEIAIKNKDDRLDEIAVELYGKSYNELTGEEQDKVNGKFYARYGYSKRGALENVILRGAIKKVVGNDKYKSATGTLRSGVKNAVAGSLDKLRAFKEQQQEKDSLFGKLFDRLDARKLRKEKEGFEGKTDSKLSKILKWVFMGGIAVPLIVGFIKDDVLPAIHKTIQPWLKKAKDKIFGVKDEQTGEYKGGIISGIVNPIRNYFKDKFQKVHNWFHNEGEFGEKTKGLSGFWQGLSKVGEHIVNLWKDGFTTVYGEWGAKLLTFAGKTLIPALGNIIKGMAEYIGDVINKKQGALELPDPDTSGLTLSNPGTTTTIPTSTGGVVQVSTPGVNTNIKAEGITSNGETVVNEVNENGTTTITNQTTGKTVTSKTTGDYYYVGKNANGLNIYKDNKTNKSYLADGNGGYIPMSEYEEAVYSNLAENEDFQHQKELEANNAFQADYTGRSAGSKVAGDAAKTMVRAGNMVVLNGDKGVKAISVAADALASPFKLIGKLPKGGLVGKLGEGIVNAGEWATKPAAFIHGGAMELAGKLGDDLTGGAFTRIGMKQEIKAAEAEAKLAKNATKKAATKALKAEKLAEKVASGEANIFEKGINAINQRKTLKAAEAAATAEKNALKAAKEEADNIAAKALKNDKLAEKVASGEANFFEKAIDTIKKFASKIKEKLSAVFKHPKVKEVNPALANNADELAENVTNGITKTLEKNSDEIAEKGASTAAKGAAKVLSIVMMVADFFLGIDNCRNLLGIVTPKPTIVERITGGIINIIPDVIMTIAEAVTGASFGGAAVIGGILAALSIIATLIISWDALRDPIVGVIIDALDLIPGVDMSDIKQKRENAKAAVEAYNAKNNTNLSIEEYNNLIGNKTVATKIGEGAKDAWSAMFGYDAGSKNALLDKTADLDSKGESDKVRKKLATIFSSIWQHYGSDEFNHQPQYDEDGNELSGKEKLNANKVKFNEVATSIITGLNSLLVKEDKETIKNVLGNCSNFVGPIDANHHLKDTFKFGYDRPSSQFKVDEEHAVWPRIRAMAGICAIMNEIFLPCDKKFDVVSIVIDIMIPAYFSDNEKEKIGDLAWTDTSDYAIDTSRIDGTVSASEDTTYEGMDKYGNKIATNANANDKLSPLSNIKDPLIAGLDKGLSWLKETNPLVKVGMYFGDLITSSIKNMTGGFEGIEEFFKSLASKNKAVNKAIDGLSLLPTDKNYWKVELDNKNPFMSSLYNFVESIGRIVKAPFALATSSLSSALGSIQNSEVSSVPTSSSSGSSGSTATTTSTSTTSTAGSTSSSSGSSGGIWQGLKNTASKIWTGIKSFFGKGTDDDVDNGTGYGNDPYHIYQRAYSGAFKTTGDTEKQTIADSGCGPASAASVLRMYGKKGDMRNAVNYALNNKYKEVNGGTYPEYFNSYLNKNGIKTNSNANNADVVNSLVQGKPVILMGRDSNNSGKTPYGSRYSHYVVARGLDKNGNVIVEDSEDKKGSTRYSLADTLNNSSVRITTGRGSGDSIANKYVASVTGLTTASVGSMIANAAAKLGLTFGKTTSSSSTSTNISGNAQAALGKSLTMSDGKGNTHTIKITQDEVELYSMLVNDCGLSPAAACGAIGNWEQECGINSIRKIATRGVIYYGGGLMQWTPGSKHTKWASEHGFGNDPWSWEANLAHAKEEITTSGNWRNPGRANPSFASEGLTPVSSFEEFKVLTDPESAAANFERVYEVSGDWNGKNSEGVVYKANMIHDNLRRLNAKILYELIVNGKSGESTETGSGKFGRGVDFSNSGAAERASNLANMGQDPNLFGDVDKLNSENNKPSVPTTLEDKQRQEMEAQMKEVEEAVKAKEAEEKAAEDQESIDSANELIKSNSVASASESSGLLSLLGTYAKKLSKGIFGNFYEALYGSDTSSDTSTGTTGTTASYNGNDAVYAAAMVFEALSKVHPNGTYKGGTFDITCRDGTKIEHVRCDCSGLMTAIIQYMGYYTYKAYGKEYSDSYHGEGLSSSMDLSQIYDKDGNPTSDWEVLTKDNAIGDNAKAGDIRFESGHTDMFVCYKAGASYPKGFNAGSTDGILASYKAAEAFFSNNNSFPMDGSIGASTIRDGTCTRAFRFKGRSASGRGSKSDKVDFAKLNRRIKSKNYVLDEQGNRIYLSDMLMKKYGRGKFGRADEDESDLTTQTTTENQQAQDTTEYNAADYNMTEDYYIPDENDPDATTTNNTPASASESKSILSNLSKYAKKAVKGVYGNFYEALYGSETENSDTTEVASGNTSTLQKVIPYSTYGIWKQGWASRDGEPHWCNKGWNTKTAISIGGQAIGPAGCSLSSTALMLVHSGVVQEADFNPGVLADDINTRSNCRGGCGTDAPMRHMCEYKGQNTMQFVDSYSWSYQGKSFDELYNFVVESMQQGYFLIGHVTNHFCCIDYVDTAHKVIFIMDPGFRANCWYDGNNKPSCLDSSDIGYTMTSGPSSKKILGVIRYKSSVSNASCYVLNGRRSFDSLHETGDAPNATIGASTGTTTTNAEDTASYAAANTSEDGSGRGKYGRGWNSVGGPEVRPGTSGDYDGTHEHLARSDSSSKTSTGVLKSYDNISRRHTNSGRGNVYGNSNTTSIATHSGRGTVMNAISDAYSQYGDPNSLANVIRLAAIIADNSNKIDDVLAVLATIAVNTENTTAAIGNNMSGSGNNKPANSSKNGLSALRTALNDNNSGEDIINAIYQIAKS